MSIPNAEALEPFRRYLEVLARVHLDSRLRGKLDPADLVQQTLLRACAALPEVRDQSPGILAASLRRILARTLGFEMQRLRRIQSPDRLTSGQPVSPQWQPHVTAAPPQRPPAAERPALAPRAHSSYSGVMTSKPARQPRFAFTGPQGVSIVTTSR